MGEAQLCPSASEMKLVISHIQPLQTQICLRVPNPLGQILGAHEVLEEGENGEAQLHYTGSSIVAFI